VFSDAAKIVVISGLVVVVIELLLMAAEKTGARSWLNWFGNLPLDIRIERDNFRLYFPVGSFLTLSLLLYLINIFTR